MKPAAPFDLAQLCPGESVRAILLSVAAPTGPEISNAQPLSRVRFSF